MADEQREIDFGLFQRLAAIERLTAIERTEGDPAVRLSVLKTLLCKLAVAQGDNSSTWVGQTTLAARCSISERTVRNGLIILERHGLIAVERRWTAGKTLNHYAIMWGTLCDLGATTATSDQPANDAGATGKWCRTNRQMVPEQPANGAEQPANGADQPANGAGATGKWCRSNRQVLPPIDHRKDHEAPIRIDRWNDQGGESIDSIESALKFSEGGVDESEWRREANRLQRVVRADLSIARDRQLITGVVWLLLAGHLSRDAYEQAVESFEHVRNISNRVAWLCRCLSNSLQLSGRVVPLGRLLTLAPPLPAAPSPPIDHSKRLAAKICQQEFGD